MTTNHIYLSHLIDSLAFLLFSLLWLTTAIITDFINRLTIKTDKEKVLQTFKDRMARSRSYDEWHRQATHFDKYLDAEQWKREKESIFYDSPMIEARLADLDAAEQKRDTEALMYQLRSGLLRNLGGLSDPNLFAVSPTGTKHLIEEYTRKVASLVLMIAQNPSVSPQLKINFFTETRQSFGNTALLLCGGATFGLFHFGVASALNQQNLLPRIISGSSIGALVGALICTRDDAHLNGVLSGVDLNLSAFQHNRTPGMWPSLKRKFVRLMKYGYLFDVKVLERCIRDNLGEWTFEEAFKATGRILNIPVTSARKFEVPSVLNYLTAPDVLIWSAACASCAITGLYDTTPLMVKQSNGTIVQWFDRDIQWEDSSGQRDGLIPRLSELFNVNHIILSQASVQSLPFLSSPSFTPSILKTAVTVFKMEIRHRLKQMNDFGWLPRALKNTVRTEYEGNVTIAPQVTHRDLGLFISNPSFELISRSVLKGERSTWGKLALIRHRLMIELALDQSSSGLANSSRGFSIGYQNSLPGKV